MERLRISNREDTPQTVGDTDGSVVAAINLCLKSELADSTLSTYQSALYREIPAAEQRAGFKLLPMDSEEKFLQLYGAMLARNWLGFALGKSANG